MDSGDHRDLAAGQRAEKPPDRNVASVARWDVEEVGQVVARGKRGRLYFRSLTVGSTLRCSRSACTVRFGARSASHPWLLATILETL